MKKFIAVILTLVIVEVVALILATKFVNKLVYGDDNYAEAATDIDNEESKNTFVVKDSLEYEKGELKSSSYLYHKPTQTIVKLSPTMHNYDYAMEIIGEENGYALVKDNGYCNVYDPNGQPVFKKDRVYSNDYFREVTILYDDMLIADYNTGEIFDMQGNPVNNFSTRFNLYYHKNSDIVNLFLFTVVPLVIFLLWYFLLWRPFKKRNTLTKGMKTTFSLLMLLIVIAVALFASIITFMFITKEHNVVIKNNFQYDIKEIEDDNGGTTKKLVWYNKDENTNVIVREFKNSTSEGSGLDIGFSNTDSYVVVNDGNLSNVYGPEGKPVFEKDMEDADLLFVDDGLLISDRHSGKYFDLKGKPVKNFYTDMDWFLYNNGNLLLCGMTLLFLVIGFILWFFLSWRRRKIQ